MLALDSAPSAGFSTVTSTVTLPAPSSVSVQPLSVARSAPGALSALGSLTVMRGVVVDTVGAASRPS
ncbi:hypothetical protein D3C87_916610 [compost metagenome]